MLLIPDEALDLIAGGYGGDASRGSVSSIPVVTIPGQAPPDDGGGGFGGWYGGWGGGYEGPGGGGSSVSVPLVLEPPKECFQIHNSPPPALVPAGVDLNNLRNMVVVLADQIKGWDNKREHGVILVSKADGSLRTGEFGHGTANGVTAEVDLFPGEKIVAWLHSHPSSNLDQRFPSSPLSNPIDGDKVDTIQISRLVAHPRADPGMLMYILDIKSGKVFEYPGKGPEERPILGNNISDDTSTTCP